ncbi:MFS transporter [Streptomyces sp. FXJ1.4098]|uniref:MFS transporter n=1 Tax=Streptomyces sp. NPDC020845 TaxID=3365096 RepID=UPI0029973ADC|nr:MFS transporter [Streptomyces sp. FXJ1.4098]
MTGLRVLVAAQAVSLAGSGINAAAVAYLVTVRSGVPALGLVQGIPLVATVACAPWIGVLVDRHDARRGLVVSSTVLAVLTALMLHYGAWWYALVLALRTPWEVALSGSLTRLLPAAAARAGVPVAKAGGTMSLTGRLATAIGVAAGPFLAGTLGPAVFVADAVTFAVTAIAFHALRLPAPATATRTGAGVARQFREGLRYLHGRPLALYTAALYTVAGIAWGAKDTLYVAYVDERLGLSAEVWAGPYGAAALVGETAAAALIASGRLGRPERIPAVATGAVLLLGGCLLTAAATTSPPVAFAAKVLEGAATNVVGVLAVTFVSLLAAEQLRGRMKTLLTTANRVSLGGAKGALPPLAGGLGVQSAYAAAGAVVLAGVALAALLLRRRPAPRPVVQR